MKFVIPRGIIYHRVIDDLKWLVKSLFCRLDRIEHVGEFETAFAELIGRQHCVAFPFARTAIFYALKAQHIPVGSDVIMPPITIKGILDVVLALGLKPVFVDLNPETLCFDANELTRSITKNTKIILITYLFGIVPDVEELLAISRQHGLFVVEDFSQCLDGQYNGKKVGSFGDVGIYSASSMKTLDTYGGGLLVCDNHDLHKDMREDQRTLKPPERSILIKKIITDLVRNLATSRILFSLVVFPLLRLLSYLKPDKYIKQTGDRDKGMIQTLPSEWFSTYTSLQALAGLEFMKKLQSENAARIRNVQRLKSAISREAVIFPSGVSGARNVYWQLIGYISKAASVQRSMHRFGVDTARSSLLQISDLKAYPNQRITPNATRLYNTGFFVPSYPGLSEQDIGRVIDAFNTLALKVNSK